ncbi:hypothetical protein BROUX41_006222 [Berkeleyomyces rouxiae]|uniref:uncharacterized protein n=1 Tax=Berkeleyomyces rouxiae TaxID=2035830 RepID=UPI003B81E3FC
MDLRTLERISRDYNLGLSTSRLQALLKDNHFMNWAELNLNKDNLLTTDELAAYSALQESGTVDRLAASEDLSSPGLATFGESELIAAIHTLTQSTAKLAQHTHTLQAQQTALSKLTRWQATNASTQASRPATAQTQRRTAAIAAARTQLQDAQAIAAQKASEARATSGHAAAIMAQTVAQANEADDRVLYGLEQLARTLVGGAEGQAEADKAAEKLNEAAIRLIKTTVELERTRLDRVYLDGLSSPMAATGAGADELESTEALQAEVESLYTEILPVAQMAVENTYLEPSTRLLRERHDAEKRHTAAGLRYTNDCFEHMLHRMEHLQDRFGSLQAHCATALLLADMAQLELSTPVPPLPGLEEQNSPQPISTMSPVRPNGRRNPIDPATPGHVHRRRRSSAAETPMEQALHILGVQVPDSSITSESTIVDHRLLKTVAEATAKRTWTTLGVAQNAQASFESSVAHALADSKKDINLLLGHFKTEYPFGDVGLPDPGMSESLAWMGKELKEMEEMISNVNIGRNAGGEKREEFVQTWN